MFKKIGGWLKRAGVKAVLNSLDLFRPMLVDHIKEAQDKLSKMNPDQLAGWIVDKVKDAIRKKYGIPNE